jgi:spore coat protein A
MKIQNKVRIVFAVFAVFALMATDAFSETAKLWPSADTSIYEGALFEDNSCGAGSGIVTGRTNDGLRRRALVKFDVASVIPAGATITSVSLTMTVDQSRASLILDTGLHKLNKDWGEGIVNCDANPGQGLPAADGDATWNFAVRPSSAWTNPGAEGDYVAGASGTTLVGTANGPYTWSTTSGMVADVQNWLDNPATNYGWIVIADENVGDKQAYRFLSRESTTPPEITIEFTCPTGGCEPCCNDQVGSFVPTGTCEPGGGILLPPGTIITPLTCDTSLKACCLPDEDNNFICQDLSLADCATAGGTSGPVGSDCRDTNVCGPEPWQDALPSPPVMQPVGTRPDGVPQYEVTMTQFKQNLHSDLPDTTVWGYNSSFPGPTIAATVGQPIEVKYINDLRTFAGTLLPTHFLRVDETPHGPNYWRDAARTVVHLHGGHVPARFDGLPEYDFLPGGFDIYEYPNNQIPATMWYHDHALGITRLNVIMGLAGFYVLNPDCNATPNDPECNGSLPSGDYDVPFVIQDRDFNLNNGDFVYPDTLQQTYHGGTIVVNGKVWPTLKVDKGKYRFRALNGSTTRTYTISYVNISDPGRPRLPITVIGTEGGFYDAPRPAPNDELTLAPAERFEYIVDFSAHGRDEIIIKNSAVTDFPGPGSEPTGGTQNIMKLNVSNKSGFTSPIPATLRPFTPIDPTGIPSRAFNLRRVGGEWLVETLDAQGNVIGSHWDDITEFPVLGDTEIWEFKNNSTLMHPMHIHLVLFQVLNRQSIDANGDPTGPIIPPDPLEANAWKDTFQSMPGTITRVIMTFEDYLGKFPYHCHIIEHEDHEMMRQFQVTNNPALCDADGICEVGEDCISCATDCAEVSGAECGNGLCETGDGENSNNCIIDCASGCGVVVADCSDPACTQSGFFCRETARVAACCGDELCEGQETFATCSNDCEPDQPCTFNDPTLTITPAARTITVDGGSVEYTLRVTNNDTGACADTTFNLTVDDSDNGVDFVLPSVLSQNSVILPPGASQNVTLTVTAQVGGTSSNDTSVISSDPATNHADVTSNMVTTTIAVGQVDCTQFTDRPSCTAEPGCRWINRDSICVNQ